MPNNSSQTNKSLDEILAELEQRFGSDSPSSSSTSSSPAPRKKKNSMSPNTIVGALVFTLLVVGVASAMWLGSRSQDLRQLAVYTGEPCSPNGITTCDAGTQYTCNAGEWQPTGTCTSPTSTPLEICPNGPSEGSYCAPGTSQGDCNLDLEYTTHDSSCPSTVRCCPIGDGPGPTATPIPCEGPNNNNVCVDNTSQCADIGGTIISGNCGPSNICCGFGGGPNPSPSVSPSLSPTPTPTPTPGGGGGGNTPTPTPVAGQCVSLTMTNLNGSTQPPRQGDSVTFTCGQVAGATRYEFRVLAPGSSTWTTLAPSSSGARVSVPFTFSQNGSFRAQCRPCTGTAASTCQAWEQ